MDIFRFLGAQTDRDQVSTGDTELNSRIQSANAKFAEYKRILTDPNIWMTTKMLYFNSLIRSRLTYSCQNWTVTPTQYDKMDRAQRKMLRRMVRGGHSRVDSENGDWSYKISTKKLLEICDTEDLSHYIKRQQKKYAAHIIRQPNSSLNKQLMFNSNDNKKLGKPVRTLLSEVLENENLGNDYIDQFCTGARHREY